MGRVLIYRCRRLGDGAIAAPFPSGFILYAFFREEIDGFSALGDNNFVAKHSGLAANDVAV